MFGECVMFGECARDTYHKCIVEMDPPVVIIIHLGRVGIDEGVMMVFPTLIFFIFLCDILYLVLE